MDPNEERNIEDFVENLEKVSEKIKEEKPDCIIAPMMGAIPFIDILNIIDENFPNEKVEYIPASSKIYKMREVLRESFKNLIRNYYSEDSKFLSLDEVVSGNSLKRIYKQFDAARTEIANQKTIEDFGDKVNFREKNVQDYRNQIINSLQYKSIGIVDSKKRRLGEKMNKEYEELVNKKIAIPINTNCIVTMDRVNYFPVKYKKYKNKEDEDIILPVVEKIEITGEYMNFLGKVAQIVGKNPEDQTIHNIFKIKKSYQWVPEHLRVYNNKKT